MKKTNKAAISNKKNIEMMNRKKSVRGKIGQQKQQRTVTNYLV